MQSDVLVPTDMIPAPPTPIEKPKAHLPMYTLIMFTVYMAIYFKETEALVNTLGLDSTQSHQVYRWYTYSLVHDGPMHIGINMMNLLIFSYLVEYDNGFYRTHMIHTISILGGAFALGWECRLIPSTMPILLMGASGGNYGLLSSQIGNLILNWKELNPVKRIIYTGFIVSPVLTDIVVNIVMYNPKISYSSHVGGFIFGIMAGMCFMYNIKVLRWEKIMKVVAAGLMLALSLASSINLGTIRAIEQ